MLGTQECKKGNYSSNEETPIYSTREQCRENGCSGYNCINNKCRETHKTNAQYQNRGECKQSGCGGKLP